MTKYFYMRHFYLILSILSILLIYNCEPSAKSQQQKEIRIYRGMDYRSFRGSRSENLATYLNSNRWRQAENEIRLDPGIINVPDTNYGNSLLFWAVLNDNIEAVDFLLNNSINIEKQTYDGEDAISKAAGFFTECDSPILEKLIQKQIEKGGIQKKFLNRGLHNAVSHDCLQKIEILIDQGADINFRQYNEAGSLVAPLTTAAIQESYATLDFLLDLDSILVDSSFFVTSLNDTLSLSELLQKNLDIEQSDIEKENAIIKKLLIKIETLTKSRN